jgi:hypothetical protein
MEGPTPGQFLSKIVERDIPVMSIVSNPVIESPEVMSDIAKALSSEAINLGFKGILEQLGRVLTLLPQMTTSFQMFLMLCLSEKKWYVSSLLRNYL